MSNAAADIAAALLHMVLIPTGFALLNWCADMVYGKLVPAVSAGGPVWRSTYIGNARDDDTGTVYELSTATSDNAPVDIVESVATGKRFVLSWTDIVNMARAAGIDDEETPR